jgi:hypothetical protein
VGLRAWVVVVVVVAALAGCRGEGHGADSDEIASGVHAVAGTTLVGAAIPLLFPAAPALEKEWSAVLLVHDPAVDVYRRFVGEARRLGLGEMAPASLACSPHGVPPVPATPTAPSRNALRQVCQGHAEDGARRLDVTVTSCGACSEQGAVVQWRGPGRYRTTARTVHHRGSNVHADGWVLPGAVLAGTFLDGGCGSDRTIWVLEARGDARQVRTRYVDALVFGGSVDLKQRATHVNGVAIRQIAYGWTGGDARLSFLDSNHFDHPLIVVEGCDDA